MLSLNVTYSNLGDRYEVGDDLKFSIRYEGAWYYGQDYTIKIKRIDNAEGELVDKIIWVSTEMQDISKGSPEQPTVIEWVVDVGKNPSDPLTLKEAGKYVVISEGKNVLNGKKYFHVDKP